MSRERLTLYLPGPVAVEMRAKLERRELGPSEYIEGLVRRDLGLPARPLKLSERLARVKDLADTAGVLTRLREEGFKQDDGALRRALFVERKRRGESPHDLGKS